MKYYEQIVADIKRNIQNNKYKPGDKLPSLMIMANQYQVSKGTVLKAYETLEKQCLIFSKPQSGYYIADGIRIQSNNHEGYHLETGNPLVNSHLFNEMKQCLNIAAELYSFKTLDLTVRGVDSLNEILPSYLQLDGIYTSEKNIYLIQGIMQMLTIFSNSPFPNGKNTILIEEPSYSFYIKYLKEMKLPVKVIKRDQYGIDLKELERIFKYEKIKFFYTIPRYHNPLGTYYDHQTRKKIMELAIKYDVYIIEDDYFSHYDPIPKYLPLYYFSNRDHCIYLRSYTKTIPFIRIGIAVVGDDFIETMDKMTKLSYYYSYHMPSLVSQATLEAYIRSDIYQFQSKTIAKEIQSKLKVVKKITKEWDNQIIELIGGKSGYYFTLKFSKKINSDLLVKQLEKEDIYVSTNHSSYYNYNNEQSIRLSISRVTKAELEFVLKRIYQIAIKLYNS